MIVSLVFIGKEIASGSGDCSIKVWAEDLNGEWKNSYTLLKHEGSVWALK